MFKCIENQFSRLIVLIFVCCFCIVVVNLLPIGEVVETIDRVQIFFASHCLVFFFFLSLSEEEDVKNHFFLSFVYHLRTKRKVKMPTKDNTTNKEVVAIKVTGWLDSFGSTYNGIISFIKRYLHP